MGTRLFEQLKQAIIDQDQDAVMSSVNAALDAGVEPKTIIDQGLLPGLNVIGEQFEWKTSSCPSSCSPRSPSRRPWPCSSPRSRRAATPVPEGQDRARHGQGDLHSIGKNILKLLFETSGFEVWDLGIDVDLFKFVDKANEVDADVIAMSALLTTTLVGQRDVIEALKGRARATSTRSSSAAARPRQAWADTIGADGWAGTAYEAVNLATKLVS